MNTIILNSIGYTLVEDNQYKIVVDKDYRKGLMSLEVGTDLQILGLFHQKEKTSSKQNLIETSPYKNGPDKLGVFATRSPNRPSPIGLTSARIISINVETGVIVVSYFDCFNNTPILDLKPYVPSFDRIEKPNVLSWTRYWPISSETSACFDWSQVFDND